MTRLLMVAAIGFVAAVVAARLDPLPAELSGAARAADGDTLHFAGARVRLLGIDAPERDQHCGRAEQRWPCGEVAQEQLATFVRAVETRCRPTGRDRYDRLLARCTARGKDLGARLVSDGLALALSDYHAEEAAARRAGRGIWSGPFENPWELRKAERGEGAASTGLAALWEGFKELTGARALR